jgi:hypothetical protein
MHAKGLTSPYARRPGAPVSVSKLAELLANPFYLGVAQWDGVRYQGQHKALIPQETVRASPGDAASPGRRRGSRARSSGDDDSIPTGFR